MNGTATHRNCNRDERDTPTLVDNHASAGTRDDESSIRASNGRLAIAAVAEEVDEALAVDTIPP